MQNDELEPVGSCLPEEWDKITCETKKPRSKAKKGLKIEEPELMMLDEFSDIVKYDYDDPIFLNHLETLKKESNLQTWVGRYLQQTYPDVLFKFSNDTTKNVKLMAKLKADGNKAGHPDLMIMRGKWEPEKIAGEHSGGCWAGGEKFVIYLGFFLELKTKKGKVGDHQKKYLQKLRKEGYYAEVAKGFMNAKTQIDNYLNPNT